VFNWVLCQPLHGRLQERKSREGCGWASRVGQSVGPQTCYLDGGFRRGIKNVQEKRSGPCQLVSSMKGRNAKRSGMDGSESWKRSMVTCSSLKKKHKEVKGRRMFCLIFMYGFQLVSTVRRQCRSPPQKPVSSSGRSLPSNFAAGS
jgi:hypothetical protein